MESCVININKRIISGYNINEEIYPKILEEYIKKLVISINFVEKRTLFK